MYLEEYARHDALALSHLVRHGEVSGAELAELAAAATERVDGILGAVVEIYPDHQAAGDAAAAAGGPFAGVPLLLKDLFHGDAGRTCENGSRLAAGWVAPVASEWVRRLRGAGLAPVGRATTSEFGVMGTTETLAQGPTCSPWSAGRMAGGSSGGSAAAVGAGIVPIATASDGGGSIRIPASACGVVGLKPTRGRVTWAPSAAEPLSGWAVHFVVTRSVRDAAVALDVLREPASGDPNVAPAPSRAYADELTGPSQALRIAFCHEPWSGAPGDPRVRAACEATAGLLAQLGHEVEQARPAFEWEQFLGAMTTIWAADLAHSVDGFAALVGREPGPGTLEGTTLAMVEHGRSLGSGRLLDALGDVNVLSRQIGAFFAGYDALLTPTLGALPAPVGRYDPLADVPPRELFASWSDLETFLPVFNATGQPAISLPLQMSEEGLPIGMQLVGRFGDEATLLALAAQLEQAQPWAGRVPPIHAAAPAPLGA
ncbi:MAG TPA: amidase family protein [Solirubrobacteraceae bacterium]|nr:amidase family protein [Solirubrobacteraceae bacterium]